MTNGIFNLVKYLGWNRGWPTHSLQATFSIRGVVAEIAAQREDGSWYRDKVSRDEARDLWRAMTASGWERDYETEGEREMAHGGAY